MSVEFRSKLFKNLILALGVYFGILLFSPIKSFAYTISPTSVQSTPSIMLDSNGSKSLFITVSDLPVPDNITPDSYFSFSSYSASFNTLSSSSGSASLFYDYTKISFTTSEGTYDLYSNDYYSPSIPSSITSSIFKGIPISINYEIAFTNPYSASASLSVANSKLLKSFKCSFELVEASATSFVSQLTGSGSYSYVPFNSSFYVPKNTFSNSDDIHFYSGNVFNLTFPEEYSGTNLGFGSDFYFPFRTVADGKYFLMVSYIDDNPTKNVVTNSSGWHFDMGYQDSSGTYVPEVSTTGNNTGRRAIALPDGKYIHQIYYNFEYYPSVGGSNIMCRIYGNRAYSSTITDLNFSLFYFSGTINDYMSFMQDQWDSTSIKQNNLNIYNNILSNSISSTVAYEDVIFDDYSTSIQDAGVSNFSLSVIGSELLVASGIIQAIYNVLPSRFTFYIFAVLTIGVFALIVSAFGRILKKDG